MYKACMVEELRKLLSSGATEARTGIDVSVGSHAIALAAEESRLHGGAVIDLPAYMRSVQK